MELSHNQRLEQLLKVEKLSIETFSETIDFKSRNISNYIKGSTNKPNGDLVINILKHYPKWNIRYWLLGQGTPKVEEDNIIMIQTSNPDEKDIVVQELAELVVDLRQELKQKDRIIEACAKEEA